MLRTPTLLSTGLVLAAVLTGWVGCPVGRSAASVPPTHPLTIPARTVASTTPPSALPPLWLGSCRTKTLPVSLPDGAEAHLTGLLCQPTWSRPAAVQLLVHGATYNSSYWSWPVDPSGHSYTWQALRRGYATFAIDKLGAGRSSAPLSTSVSFTAQALAVHQAIQALRSGTLGHRYRAVVVVAHSFGSAESFAEQSTWHDADALVATGSGHALSKVTAGQTVTDFGPGADLVPLRFGDRDPGYITTTTKQARREVLYNDVTPDSMVNYDHRTRDVFSSSEVSTRPPDLSALTKSINEPVLLLNGSLDSHYCSGVTPQYDLDDCSSPSGLYGSEHENFGRCFAASVVLGSGHDLTTEAQARSAASITLDWVARTVPATTGRSTCAATGPFGSPQR